MNWVTISCKIATIILYSQDPMVTDFDLIESVKYFKVDEHENSYTLALWFCFRFAKQNVNARGIF